MTNELKALVEKAKSVKMTATQKETQRRSFAYGNTSIENELITRETIDRAAARLNPQDER